jgi:hypothetical protein
MVRLYHHRVSCRSKKTDRARWCTCSPKLEFRF